MLWERLMIGLFLRIAVTALTCLLTVSAGFGQTLAPSSLLNKYQAQHQARNFTPVNLSALGTTTPRKAPAGEQVAYWSACGGSYNTRACAPCARATDYVGPAPQCVFCHSCGNGCPDDRRVPGGC